MIPADPPKLAVILALFGTPLVALAATARPSTSLTLEMTGGSHVGSHKLSSENSHCTLGSGDPDRWETNFGDNEPEPGALSLFVLNVPHTAEGSTTDFSLSAGFNPFGSDDYQEYALEPATGNGTGTLTLEQTDRKHALVTVTGTTAEGVGLTAVLTCTDVMNLSGELMTDAELSRLNFAPDATAPTGSLRLTIGEQVYDRKTGAEGGCSRIEGDDLWYGYEHAGGEYTDLLLYVESLAAAASGTARFGFGVDLAPIHEVGATGTLTATVAGEQVTLVMDTRTAAGTPVQATIVCASP